jgi:hypothetical protein
MRKLLAPALVVLAGCMPDKDCVDPQPTSKMRPGYEYTYYVDVGNVKVPIFGYMPPERQWQCRDGRTFWR